ncbi:single-stranded-DNA-specific exonuclease RecJ [Thermosipho ferrireducens]|uniref:Single-stranded-DNA-specific exonuclease RecJ n=1 Tax=Thermosipho ferrireducens TaxID=2571116 RepID=A0ABX7S628_9BACT|nr:single-stranded-DNA-specific exonuclease RecJ [Thermosipho ferrireducens]QTA37180.1 single-stranded-DNA-specific exonuclease RecJ [Thermosipho ferrireducens]
MRWKLRQFNKELVNELSKKLKIPYLTSQLLVTRGFNDPEKAWKFINPIKEDLRSPFLLKDMSKAVEILIMARQKGLPVLVYGDYDVDGITGTATLVSFLSKHGWEVDYYIPNRLDEGYGIQPSIVQSFYEKGFKVLLSVDCGITSFEAVELTKKLGMYAIITDHHSTKDVLPVADAVIDPKRADDNYPFKDFAGVGVAYKLITALAKSLDIPEEDVDTLLDLVALGTIADMVELVDENRYIVKEGLKKLNNTNRIGLIQLIKKLNLNYITSQDIGYRIAPKLNAAGRLYSAEDAFKLIMTENMSSAEQLAEILLGYNFTRQEIETKIYEEAVAQIESTDMKDAPVLVVYKEGWHAGVIGIVATKLVQRYNKPALVISLENGIGRGSGRSIEGINILEILKNFSHHFEEFGGHPMAIGFSILENNIKPFIKELKDKLEEQLLKVTSSLTVDAILTVDEINEEVLEALRYLEPYGHGNPEPIFLIRNSTVDRIRFFGNNGTNVRLTLRGKHKLIEGIGFGLKKQYHEIPAIQALLTSLDVAANIRENGVGPVLNVIDFKVSAASEEEYKDKYFIYSFTNNWRNQNSEDFDYYHSNEILQRFEKVKKYTSFSKPFVLQTDPLTRNAFLIYLMEKSRTLIINPTNVDALHIYESLSRHCPKDLSFVNSINTNYKKHVITNAIMILENVVNISDFDTVVLNEIQILPAISSEIFSRLISRTGKNVIITSIYNFETNIPLYSEDRKINFGLEDRRNTKKSIEYDSNAVAYVFSNYHYVDKFYEKLMKASHNPKDMVFYSPILEPFQKKAISTLVRKKRIKKLVCSTNTDGLPSMLQDGVEIKLYDFPLTVKELIDAVAGSSYSILQLFYNKEDVNQRLNHLQKIFPSNEKLKTLFENITTIPSNEEIQQLSVKYNIPEKVLRSVLKNLITEKTNTIEYAPEKILRLKEREIELPYFEKYTMMLLNANIKDIYKMIEERYLYDVYLQI